MADGNPPAEAAPQTAEPSTRTAIPGASGGSSRGAAPGQEATFGFVTQQYTNYVTDIQQAYEALRQRAVALQQDAPAQLQELQSKIQPQTQELVQTIQDTEAPIAVQTGHVVEIFGFSSVLLLTFGIASIVSGYVLSPVLGIFVGRFGAALAASLFLPAGAAYYLSDADGSVPDTRSKLLALAALQGLLLGHALAYTYVAGQPLSFITPLSIAFAYPMVAGQVGTAHIPLVGGTVGAALAVQLVVGVLGGLLSASYFLMALLYSGASGAVLQFANKYLQAPNKVHLYQILLVGSILFSKALVYALLGNDGAHSK